MSAEEEDMSETPEKDTSKKEKKPFIHETITGSAGHSRKLGGKVLLTLGLAVVFGLTASLTFVVSRPMWENHFSEPETSESVTIVRDNTTVGADATQASAPSEAVSETAAEEESETEPDTRSADEWREEIQAMIDNNRADMDDYKTIHNELSHVASAANKSLVTVTASSTDTDWFDNPVSSNQETCGVIVVKTSREILILTNAEPLSESDSLRVTFGAYGEGEAYLKQQDGIWGLAIVAVPLDTLDETIRNSVEAIELGNSYAAMQGQPVIAIGSPLGYYRSVAYGVISYINNNVQGTDALVRLLQTDIPDSENSCGMLIDTDGKLIGWLTNKYSGSTTSGLLSAISISDMKPLMEKLSNGKAMACLGIRGQNVTAEIAERQELPLGVYITRCVSDRPAYLEGLQSGDVLTAINEDAVSTMEDLQRCLEKYEPGDAVTITAQRSGREGYTEFTVDVTLQAR